ncbi:TIM barrel protein [Thioclava litoralis]|uniref:TIM barrel protein n=1 Tax=Thioclava litoralis TaxID=3076557 RepID=A0ABZ1DY26_9RHOB|nr:TIM barrel protein [Thioclava sp. FTW29]
MPKFAADLDHLFSDRPLMTRFSAAKSAGFDAVEMRSPYDAAAPDLRYQLVMNDLFWTGLDAPPPNYTGGLPGYAGVAGQEDRFLRDLKRALRVADVLKSGFLTLLAGPEAQIGTLIGNLKAACKAHPKARFMITPEGAGSLLPDLASCAHVLAEVGGKNLCLAADLRSPLASGEDPIAWVTPYLPQLGHLWLAGADGHEPAGESLDLAGLCAHLDAGGYSGYVCANYTPRETTEGGLAWLRRIIGDTPSEEPAPKKTRGRPRKAKG